MLNLPLKKHCVPVVRHGSLVYWSKTADGWAAMAISVGDKDKIQGISGKVDHVRTAYIYKEKSWSTVMQQRQNRDQLVKEE